MIWENWIKLFFSILMDKNPLQPLLKTKDVFLFFLLLIFFFLNFYSKIIPFLGFVCEDSFTLTIWDFTDSFDLIFSVFFYLINCTSLTTHNTQHSFFLFFSFCFKFLFMHISLTSLFIKIHHILKVWRIYYIPFSPFSWGMEPKDFYVHSNFNLYHNSSA